jgi:hypothetical protein
MEPFITVLSSLYHLMIKEQTGGSIQWSRSLLSSLFQLSNGSPDNQRVAWGIHPQWIGSSLSSLFRSLAVAQLQKRQCYISIKNNQNIVTIQSGVLHSCLRWQIFF